jgi:S-formylglutathione hydrolase FrmB
MNRTDRLSKFVALALVSLCLAIVSPLFRSALAANQSTNGSVPPSQKAVTVKDVAFHSQSLGRNMRYRVFLPRNYARSSKRFPVLYLLHGVYGNFKDWDTLSDLRRYAENLDLIIVMPDGGNNWYVNSATVTENRYEDYVVRDLVAEVDERYRTIPSQESRAIAGLSMGAYGSLNLALKHPGLFAFAGSLSGALNAPSDLGPRQPEFQSNLLPSFGPPGSATRTANDVFILLRQSDVSHLPYIYLACGEGDAFIDLNRQFAAQLLEMHAHFEAHFQAGGHDWKFWDKSIRDMLPVVTRTLQPTAN